MFYSLIELICSFMVCAFISYLGNPFPTPNVIETASYFLLKVFRGCFPHWAFLIHHFVYVCEK